MHTTQYMQFSLSSQLALPIILYLLIMLSGFAKFKKKKSKTKTFLIKELEEFPKFTLHLFKIKYESN